MKALNSKEITSKYLIFLLNFSVLLTLTVICYFLFLKADTQQSNMIVQQKRKHEFIFDKRQQLTNKIDTLNRYLLMLNTEQVENEPALKRTIMNIKNEASKQMEQLKSTGDATHYILFDKIIYNVDKAIDFKNEFQKASAEEKRQKQKLDDCIELNNNITNELRRRN